MSRQVRKLQWHQQEQKTDFVSPTTIVKPANKEMKGFTSIKTNFLTTTARNYFKQFETTKDKYITTFFIFRFCTYLSV